MIYSAPYQMTTLPKGSLSPPKSLAEWWLWRRTKLLPLNSWDRMELVLTASRTYKYWWELGMASWSLCHPHHGRSLHPTTYTFFLLTTRSMKYTFIVSFVALASPIPRTLTQECLSKMMQMIHSCTDIYSFLDALNNYCMDRPDPASVPNFVITQM